MITISERQKEILDGIIGEYIDSAQPVSSQLVEKRHNLGICPATIRIEMQKLTEAGYLCQPHTSAGRIPTDKGYRFFVDNLLEKGINDFENISEIQKIVRQERKDTVKFIWRLAKFLSDASSELATVYLFEKDCFWKEGWEEVLLKPEFNEKNFVVNFTNLLENFGERAANLKLMPGIKVYIGRENPLPKAREFSIIFSKCRLPEEGEAIFTLLGPKRMDYDRNIGLFHSLIKALEEF
jgi:heat-inducible transcriptional repressor